MPDYLYLDIETVPTRNPADIAQIAASITPPAAMKKAETIAEWEASQKPQAVLDAVAKTSFNGAYGQVCCIGWAWNDDYPSHATLGLPYDTEAGVISALANITRPSREAPVIVGHYVADFDLRFLWQRAFVLGVRMPAWWPKDPKPWGRDVHDTMTMWAGAKGTISLDNLCRALGIEGKGDVDGSMVAEMFERHEYDAIARYCMSDVRRTRLVHQKMLIAMGGGYE